MPFPSYNQGSAYRRRPSDDKDYFDDLLWEEDIERLNRAGSRKKYLNLTSRIEDYLRDDL